MNPLEWRIRRLRPAARIPSKAHSDDAGWDLHFCAPEGREHEPPPVSVVGDRAILKLPTGLAMAFSPGWVFKIEARSGLAAHHGVLVLAGVVDAGYRGEVIVLLSVPVERTPEGSRPLVHIKHGERVAQGVFLPVPEVSPQEVFDERDLPASHRGEAGFGSSGNR